MINKTCYCGKAFQVRNYRDKTAKFCSHECAYSFKRKGESPLSLCQQCGKEFKRWSIASIKKKGKGKFCSMECYAKSRTIKGRDRVCGHCGKEFKAKWSCKVTDYKYCSLKCFHLSISGENSPRWKGGYENQKLLGHKYRSRRSNNGHIALEDWEHLLESFKHKCAFCGKKKPLTLDHIIPLSKGGKHEIENVQPLCRSCNSKKGTKTLKIDKKGQFCIIYHMKEMEKGE